jgi:hypothetical protein
MAIANAGALAAFVAVWRIMGVDRALVRGSWRESDLFAGVVLVLVGLAGVAGGAACGAIARRWWVVAATSMLLLGWWSVEGAVKLAVIQASDCETRAETASFVDGARAGLIREPAWSALSSPVAIGIGVLLGGTGLAMPVPVGDRDGGAVMTA